MSSKHYDENTSIHFKDFSTDKEDVIEAKENLDLLLRYAPCGANCQLQISASGKFFVGSLEVKTRDKVFRVEHKDSQVKNLQHFMFQKIKKDLDQWKKERSEEDITGMIHLDSLNIRKYKKSK